MDKVQRTEAQWRGMLTPDEYQVLREAGTEAPWTGEYTNTKVEGVYRCRACGAELFRSGEKFESHCGWPSFYQPSSDDAVELIEDSSLGMVRTEVRCARCRTVWFAANTAALSEIAASHRAEMAQFTAGPDSDLAVLRIDCAGLDEALLFQHLRNLRR